MQITTQQQGLVTVAVDKVAIPGPWQSFDGDEVTADIEKVFPGHMMGAIGLAGPPSNADIVVARLYDVDAVDDLYEWLRSRVSAGLFEATRAILNPDKTVRSTGAPRIGTLSGVSRSSYDATASGAVVLTLTASIDGP